MTSEFKNESDAWLNPKGYSTRYIFDSGNLYTVSYINISDEFYPSINCTINKNNGKKYVELVATAVFKLFLSLHSGKLQYKHPNIDDYITKIRDYSIICAQYENQ